MSRLVAAWARLDRARQEALTLAVGAVGVVIFVVARWFVAADQQLSRFVVAGPPWTALRGTPRFLHVFTGSSGFDGQFYWRLAIDPAHLSLARYFGVRIDSDYRLNRILYPALAWAVSFGHSHEVSLSLIIVNAAAVIGVVLVGLYVARRSALTPLWALCPLLTPGLVGAVSRDLTEALMCALALVGVLAMRDRHWVVAALAFSGAVLTRETMVLLVAVYAICALAEIVRRRRSWQRADLAWVIPALVFVGWQVVVRADVGAVPILSSAGSGDVGIPFWGFLRAVPGWFSPDSAHQSARSALYVLQTLGVVWLGWVAWCNRRTVRHIEFVVVALFALLVVCETRQGWAAPLDARYATFPMALTWLHLIEGRNATLLRRALFVLVPVVGATVLWRIAVI